MRFSYPVALVGIALVPWVWWTARSSALRLHPLRLAWRLVTIAVLALGAAGVHVVTGQGPLTVMAAIDQSASVPGAARQRALASVDAFAATMHGDDRLGVVTFAADAAVSVRPAHARELPAPAASIRDSATDIAAAIKLSRSVLPYDGARRILLVTDGQQTTGDAEREALTSSAEGVAIDVMTPDAPVVTESPRVVAVSAPRMVAADEPFSVTVEVSGSAGARSDVGLYRGDQLVTRAPVALDADGRGTVVVAERLRDPGEYLYRASIGGTGAGESADTAGTIVAVAGRARVLYVSSSRGVLTDVLAGAGFAVTPVRPAAVPISTASLTAYSAVVLDDVAAGELAPEASLGLRRYVEQTGGGLLLLGSARTLTLDQIATGPLGDLLPIDLRPRAGSRAPSIALVVVFDKSGSMADVASGVAKIELAREAVLRVADVLPSGDALGVVAFDSQPSPVVPLGALDRRGLADRLQRVTPAGSTTIAPALEQAFDWLRTAPATRRQILLLSDGRTSEQDAARVAALVRRGGATVSVVAIGPDANRGLLEPLAVGSGGRAYFPDDVRELPLVVAREAVRAAGGGIVDERFVPHASPHPVLAGIGAAPLPPLNGYVVAAAKPTASVIVASHLDDPVLAAWRAGLGRVAVYTADLGSTWSAPWRQWRDDARLWTQTVRWIGRPVPDGWLHLSITDSRAGTRVQLEARDSDGAAVDLDDIRASVRTPAGDAGDLAFSAIEPARWAAPLTAGSAGAYTVSLVAHDRATGEEHRAVQTLYWAADRERRRAGVDLPLLERLAAMTGGRRLRDGESPFAAARPWAYADAARWALAIGLAMFVGDMTTAGRRRPGHRITGEESPC